MVATRSKTLSRRQFCKRSLLYGAGIYGAGTLVGSSLLIRTTGASAAQVTLKFASPYANDSELAPSAQGAFKRNIEKVSGGAIQVELAEKGKKGVGGKLLGGVARNSIQGGIISVSNLSKYTTAVDVLNIPFWSASNQNFRTLVSGCGNPGRFFIGCWFVEFCTK